MKAQKLGLVLGMNMAVACLVMQGCKANKPIKDLPPPEVTTVDQPGQPPEQQPVVTEVETTPAPSVPGAVPQQGNPSPVATTRTVSKLPPPAKPVATKKPQGGAATPSAAPAAAMTVHTVKKNEQLWAISKKYNVKLSSIVAANPGINPDRISIGQKINIPGVVAAPKSDVMLASASATCVAPAAANTVAPVKVKPAFKSYTGPTKEYVVRGGDSLGKIALANGISIRALKELNGLTKDSVRVGQKLKVPAEKVAAEKPAEKKAAAPAVEKKDAAAPAPAPETKNDKAAAPVEAKKSAEPTASAPAADSAAAAPAAEANAAPAEAAPAAPAEAAPAPEPAGSTYTVKEGDDIVSISIAWGISPSQLMNANDLKDNEPLKPGTVLKLPPNARQTVQ